MAGLKNTNKGLSASQLNINNTKVEKKEIDLQRQISNVQEDTKALLAELSLYTNNLHDPLKASDPTRNPIQKLLNLKANQGMISSALTLINRPAEALQGGVVAMMNAESGADLVKNVLDGLVGNEEFGFKDTGIDLGDNPFVNGVAGMAFEVFIDPLNFVNQPFKLLYTKGKDVFKSVKNKAEIFFAKTDVGTAMYSEFSEVLNKVGTQTKKTFNLWKDPALKVATNQASNLNAALIRGKEQGAGLIVNLLETSMKVPKQVIKEWNHFAPEELTQIREALELPSDWIPSQEVSQLVAKTYDNPKEFAQLYQVASSEARENFSLLNNQMSKYLSQIKEAAYPHGENIGNVLTELSTSNYAAKTEVGFNGATVHIRSDAFTDVAAKTLSQFTSSQAFLFLKDVLEKATGKTLVEGAPKKLDQIAMSDLIQIQEGVGRYLMDNTNNYIPSPAGGNLTAFSKQGYQMWLTDEGKAILSKYQRQIKNAQLSQIITKNYVGEESKYLIDLVNYGEVKFNPNYIDAVENMVEPLKVLYKTVTNKDLKFVTSADNGQMLMKIVPEAQYGIDFIPELLNDRALDKAKDLLNNQLNKQIEQVHRVRELAEQVKTKTAELKTYEQAVNSMLTDKTIMGMIFDTLKKENKGADFKALADDVEFLTFVQQAEKGIGSTAPFAPSDDSVKFVNTQLNKYKGKFEAIEHKGITYRWDKLKMNVSSASFPMTIPHSALNVKQKINYVAYLRDRGIITDETLKVAGINSWSDFKNKELMAKAFEDGYFPSNLSVKVSSLTKKGDVSNSYINLAQWNKVGMTPFKNLSQKQFIDMAKNINKQILDGKLLSEENIQGLYEYFSVQELKDTLTSVLGRIGDTNTQELIANMTLKKKELASLTKKYTKQANNIAEENIETLIQGAIEGNSLTKPMVDKGTNLIKQVGQAVQKKGKEIFVLERIDEIKKYESQLEELSKLQAQNLEPVSSVSLFKLQTQNKDLYDFTQSSRFKNNGKYTSPLIIDQLSNEFLTFKGIHKLPEGSWEFITAEDLDMLKQGLSEAKMKSIITFDSVSSKNIFESMVLKDLRHASYNQRIGRITNALFDANAEMIYALNMGEGSELYKALDLDQINYLKKQNYAKSANAMLNEISIGNIQFAVKKQQTLVAKAQAQLNEWTKAKSGIDVSTEYVGVLERRFENQTNKVAQLQQKVDKTDYAQLKQSIKVDKEKVDALTKEYNEAFQKHNKFKDGEYTKLKNEYNNLKEKQSLHKKNVAKSKFPSTIRRVESKLKKAKTEADKQLLTKSLETWKAMKAIADNDLKLNARATMRAQDAFLKAKATRETLRDTYTSILTKRNALMEKTSLAKRQIELTKHQGINAELTKAKAELNKTKKELKSAKETLDLNIKQNEAFERTKELAIKEAEQLKKEAKTKQKEYAKEELVAIKRSDEEFKKQLEKAGNQQVNGTLEQLAEGMNSDIYTFYNPLASASPQFIAGEYLIGKRHDLTMVAELLTTRKNMQSIQATYEKLPQLLESSINNFVNVDQAVYGFMSRFIKESTGVSIKSWEVEGYMRHMLNGDEAVIKILQNTANGMDSSIAGQVFGNNAKKLLMAREYQGSAFDVNKAFGSELFNTNPVQATAMALDLFPNNFKKTATIKSLVENRLITTVDIKDYAGFNPTRTRESILTRIDLLETRVARNKAKGKQNNRLEDELAKSKRDLGFVDEYQKVNGELEELQEKVFNLKAQNEFNEIKKVKEQEIKDLKQEIQENLNDANKVKQIEEQIDAIKKELTEAQEYINSKKMKGEEKTIALNQLEKMRNKLQELAPKLNVADTRDFVSQQKWLDANPQFQGAPGEWAIMDEANIKELEQAVDLIYRVDPHSLDDSEWGTTLKNLVEDIRYGGKQNVIHKGALDILKTLGKASGESAAKSIFKTMQKLVITPWKTIATTNLGFHLRNFTTNFVNSTLFGFNPMKVFQNAAKHNTDLIKFHKDLKILEVATATGKWRTSDEQAEMIFNLIHQTNPELRNAFFEKYDAMDVANMFEVNEETSAIFKEMMEMSSKGIVGNNQFNSDVFDESIAITNAAKGRAPKFKYKPDGPMGNATDHVKKWIAMSYNWSKRIDDGFKIGTYKYIKNLDPTNTKDLERITRLADMGFGKKIQLEDGSFEKVFRKDFPDVPEIDAEAATKFVGFDYNNLSYTENTLMKSIFPFYTWARKNIEFQMRNILHNDKQYRNIFKALRGWRRAFVNEDEEYEYQENWIPVWSENGTVQYIKFSIPFFEADEIISGGGIVNSLSPIFKTPLEMVTGFDFFTKREIASQQNPGFGIGLNNIFRTGQVITDMLFNDYAPSYEDKKLAGILGKKLIDVTQIAKNIFSFSANMENDGMVNTIATLFPSIFSPQQLANVQYQNLLIKRKRAEEALKYAKSRRGIF